MSATVTLLGNLTKDPELRYTREGQAHATFSVAVNRRWLDKESGAWEESVSYFDVVCWRELAEHAAISLERGTRVIVAGRLEQRSWESENGERRYRIEVVADEVGPSLRYRDASVARSERPFTDTPPNTPSSTPSNTTTKEESVDHDGVGEEPFLDPRDEPHQVAQIAARALPKRKSATKAGS